MDNGKAIVVTFGNFKGGTGKTTNSTLLAYELATQGKKVLLCDQDPQANATSLYLKTKELISGDLHSFNKIGRASCRERV